MPRMAEYLEKVLWELQELRPNSFLEDIEMDWNHFHLHRVILPIYAVSKVVEILKSVPRRRLKEQFPHVLSKGRSE